LRQSLDTIGAFSGPLLAIALMALLDNDFRLVFWIALIPGLISVAILIVVVREPETLIRAEEARPPIRWADIRRLGNGFYGVVVVGTVLTLARFSEAFLVLRAQALGLPLALVPLVLVVMNVVYALSAYPMGVLSDRVDRKRMLMAGFGVLILADLVLAAAPNIWLVMLGVGLWGLHMGMTQGLLATLVADAAPSVLRGTAFGVFNLVSGVALLIASVVAGGLWELVGAPATFLAGAAFSLVGVIGAGWIMTRRASEDPLNP
jgi:MFS family permease